MLIRVRDNDDRLLIINTDDIRRIIKCDNDALIEVQAVTSKFSSTIVVNHYFEFIEKLNNKGILVDCIT